MIHRDGDPADPIRLSWGIEIEDAVKVSSVVRQDVPEGEEPDDLPEPRGLQGVARRPIPLASLTKQTRVGLSRLFRELSKKVMTELQASGLADPIAEDAAGYIRAGGGQGKGPVGRGGQPLGTDTRVAIQRVWNRPPMKIVADLLEEEIDSWSIRMGTYLDGQYPKIYTSGAKAGQRQLGVRPSFDLQNPFILGQLGKRANLLTGGVSQDVFNRIRTVIADEFYLKGKNPLDVAASLRGEFSFLEKTRSETIARTETLAVQSEGAHTQYQASGVEWKRWLTTLDGRERETHFRAHGQMQKIDDPFDVGNSQLMYPGDPSGEIGEIARCRCANIPVILAGQQFTGSDVWRGDVAPDEFAKDRQRAA